MTPTILRSISKKVSDNLDYSMDQSTFEKAIQEVNPVNWKELKELLQLSLDDYDNLDNSEFYNLANATEHYNEEYDNQKRFIIDYISNNLVGKDIIPPKIEDPKINYEFLFILLCYIEDISVINSK